jgi:hypothetical protein
MLAQFRPTLDSVPGALAGLTQNDQEGTISQHPFTQTEGKGSLQLVVYYRTYLVAQTQWFTFPAMTGRRFFFNSHIGGWSPNGSTRHGGHWMAYLKIGRRNRSTRRKPAPAPLCPPQIPLDQTRARTRTAAVGSQRLTAWAMARPRKT